jgi:hypothetical protein
MLQEEAQTSVSLKLQHSSIEEAQIASRLQHQRKRSVSRLSRCKRVCKKIARLLVILSWVGNARIAKNAETAGGG